MECTCFLNCLRSSPQPGQMEMPIAQAWTQFHVPSLVFELAVDTLLFQRGAERIEYLVHKVDEFFLRRVDQILHFRFVRQKFVRFQTRFERGQGLGKDGVPRVVHNELHVHSRVNTPSLMSMRPVKFQFQLASSSYSQHEHFDAQTYLYNRSRLSVGWLVCQSRKYLYLLTVYLALLFYIAK